jgi:hypothetical protein
MTLLLTLPRATTPMPRITTLPPATPLRQRNTTRLRMLLQLLHRGSSYYTEAPATTPRLQLLHRGSSYYTEAPATFSTQTVEYYTEAPKYYSATIYTATTEVVKHYAAPTYYTKTAPSYYVEQKCYTDAPVYYTPTYAKSSNNTEASEHCTEEASYYTTTFVAPI